MSEEAEEFYWKFINDFTYWYAHFLAEEKRAWEDGWRTGYEAGRRDYFQVTEAEWAAVLRLSPWWISDEPSYERLEEMRYGKLPDNWEEPASESYPGIERRSARALNPREGDYLGGSG